MAAKTEDKKLKSSGKGLGKGLGALLQNTKLDLGDERKEEVQEIDINEISPNSAQPRKKFDEEKLEELAASIKENGVIQPILLSKNADGGYLIIAGERRWRAARIAGLQLIPAIVRDLDEELRLRHALIENIQRENLNPMETSDAYALLMGNHGMTQEELAEILGKSRSAVANCLRLQHLPQAIRDMLIRGDLSEGHARTLLALPSEEEQLEAADQILLQAFNVRQTEDYVRRYLEKKEQGGKKSSKDKDPQAELSIRKVEQRLSRKLGAKIQLKDKGGKGFIKIPYKNLEELDRILEFIEN